jgi:hypothetical protein
MSQDIVSYKQKVVLIADPEIFSKMKSDDNLFVIIKALRKGPMTVNELVKEFEDSGIKKSDKSVYRYLKELIDMKFVARAGKRITSKSEKDLQSETIYIRTAKVFWGGGIDNISKKLGEEKTSQLIDMIFSVLNNKYPDKITSSDGIMNLLHRFDDKKHELIEELFDKADDETLQKQADLDWGLVEYMIEYIGWLALLLEIDVEKEFDVCFSK